MWQLQEYLACSARRQDTAEDHRSPSQRVLRARRDPTGGTENFPTEPLYHRYDVRDSSATEVGVKETSSIVCMFIYLAKAYDSVDGTLLWRVLARFWRATKEDLFYSSIS